MRRYCTPVGETRFTTPNCHPPRATIVGSGSIEGTPGDDLIVGSPGRDTIFGGDLPSPEPTT